MRSESDPKTMQMHTAEPFKTRGIYSVEASLGYLGRGRKWSFLLFVFLLPIFSGSWWLYPTLGSPWCSKWTPGSVPNCTLFHQAAHKCPHRGQEGSGASESFSNLHSRVPRQGQNGGSWDSICEHLDACTALNLAHFCIKYQRLKPVLRKQLHAYTISYLITQAARRTIQVANYSCVWLCTQWN